MNDNVTPFSPRVIPFDKFDNLDAPLRDLLRMMEIADRLAIDLSDAKIGSPEHAKAAELLVFMVWETLPKAKSILALFSTIAEGGAE
jgi:hypothetical protein